MILSREFLKASLSGDISLIKNYLVIESTELCPADMVLAFGNSRFEPVAKRAAALYHEGLAPVIVSSGGVETHTGQNEAMAMRHIMRRAGVPDSAIVVEDRATNTMENVIFSREAMQCQTVNSVISAGHAVAGRRFLMTLAQNWPEVFAMASHVWNEDRLSQEWHKDPETVSWIRDQFARIQPYIEAGYIREVDPKDISAEALRRHGKAGLDRTARHAL